MEKHLLREAFKEGNYLPDDVLWRNKEAFSDGVSSPENSWHNIIKSHINTKVSDDEFEEFRKKCNFNIPELKESYYYRKLFETFYPNKSNIIPHFWMPKWTNTNDPSARELNTPKE